MRVVLGLAPILAPIRLGTHPTRLEIDNIANRPHIVQYMLEIAKSARPHRRTRWVMEGIAVIAVLLWAIPVTPSQEPVDHEQLRRINGRIFRTIGGHLIEVSNVTLYCLACHDGAVGPARQGPSVGGGGCSSLGLHPVGRTYPAGEPGFNDWHELPASMHFEYGRTTCVTCHSTEDIQHRLNVPTRRSSLCLTCHRK